MRAGEHSARLRVLFLCTGNACRSQMAEGWARRLLAGRVEAHSAGIEPYAVDPLAIHVMAEAGVDISGQTSKHVDVLKDLVFDFVITLCDQAHQSCPVFTGSGRILHRGFDDPPRLASRESNREDVLAHYRRVRDEIRDFVKTLPDWLEKTEGGR